MAHRERMDALQFPFAKPDFGQMTEVAPRIFWLRLPLPMALDHVNCYLLEDDEGWSIFDCGLWNAPTLAIWEGLLAGPLARKPILRLIVSHHHIDHIGMAGWFQARGVTLHMTRLAWLYGRMLSLDVQEGPTPEQMAFWRGAGLSDERLGARAHQRPSNAADVTHPMPLGFVDVQEGQIFHMAGRDWQARIGHGHAPSHITLWADEIILGGDQLLPGISANLGAYATEPLADPVGEWLQSCRAFLPFARADHLVLPGHKLPYYGLPFRLHQMVENHISALDRLMDFLVSPKTAVECFPLLFKRKIGPEVEGLALAEAMAHLNHLFLQGKIRRVQNAQGAWLYCVA